MELSIIVATYDRFSSLRRLLESLRRMQSAEAVEHEVIVANNAGDERTAAEVERLVKEFAGRDSGAFRHVREPSPGKCRAQNCAIEQARGSVIGFLDDDVEVTSRWLQATSAFFKNSPFQAMQGPILVPLDVVEDPRFLEVYHQFRTIPFVQYGSDAREITTLTGGNMAIRRELFARIGLFDERLGPGRSGISEDVEFAQRMIRAGERIGYEPKAAVYHEVDWSRLTEEFFRLRHEQQGRSRLLYKRNSLLSIAPNVVRSVWTFGWYSLIGNQRKKYRAKGRYFHYRAMLAEKCKIKCAQRKKPGV